MNLPPFKIGQKVVYITGHILPKDSIHTVSDVFQQSCGCWSIRVFSYDNGLNDAKEYFCRVHGAVSNKVVLKRGFNPNSFRAIDESFAEEALENIKEQINEEQLVRI